LHFLGDHLVQDFREALQLAGALGRKVSQRRQLVKVLGKIELREHGLHFRFRHAAIQQRLYLLQKADVGNEIILVHARRERIHLRQQRRVLIPIPADGGILAEKLHQLVHIGTGLLDSFLVPYREHNLL